MAIMNTCGKKSRMNLVYKNNTSIDGYSVINSCTTPSSLDLYSSVSCELGKKLRTSLPYTQYKNDYSLHNVMMVPMASSTSETSDICNVNSLNGASDEEGSFDSGFCPLASSSPEETILLHEECKDLVKRCQQCREIIANAKEKQENQARRNAHTLLEQIEAEEVQKATKQASQAKKREKKKMKKKKAKEKDKPEPANGRKVNEIAQALLKPEPESNDEQSYKENINKQSTNNTEKKEKKNNKNKSAEKETTAAIEKIYNESTNQKSTQSTKKEIPSSITTTTTSTTSTKKLSKSLEAKSTPPSSINTTTTQKNEEHVKSDLSDVTKILKEIQIEDDDIIDPDYEIGIASDDNEEERDWNAFIEKHSSQFLSTTKNDKGENWKVVTKKNPNVNNNTTNNGSLLSANATPLVSSTDNDWKVIPTVLPPNNNNNSSIVKETKDSAAHVSSRKKIQMNVSRHDIGKVIGQGGSVVSALRTMSGAQIDIESAKGDDIGERMVCLKGQSELIVNLQEIIIALIQGTITGNDILARFVIHKKSAKAGPIPNFSLSSLVIKNIPKQAAVTATTVASKKSPGAFIKPLGSIVTPISKPSPVLAPVSNVNFATVAAVNPPIVNQTKMNPKINPSVEQSKKKSLTNSSSRLPKLVPNDKMTPLKLDISNIFHNPDDATIRGEEGTFENSNSASAYSMKNSRRYDHSSGASNHDTNSTAPFGLSSPFPSTNNTTNSNVANFSNSTVSKSPIPCASDEIPIDSNPHMSPVTPSNSSKSFARAPGSERSMKNHGIQMPNQKLPIGNPLTSSNMLMTKKIFSSNTNLFSLDDQQNEGPFLLKDSSVTPNKRNQNMNDLDGLDNPNNWPTQNSLLSNGFDHFVTSTSNGLDSLLSNQQKLLNNVDNVDLLTDSYLGSLSQPQTSSLNAINNRTNGDFVSYPPGITSTCSPANRVMRPTSFINNNNNNNPLSRNGNDIHPNVGGGNPLAQYRVPAFGVCPPPPNGPANNNSLHHLQIVNTQLPPPNLMQQSIPPHPAFGAQNATPHSLFSKQHGLLSQSSSLQRVLPSYSGMNSPNGLFPNMAEYTNPSSSMLPPQTNGGLTRQVNHIQSNQNNSMPPILTGNSSIVAPIGSERRRNLQNM